MNRMLRQHAIYIREVAKGFGNGRARLGVGREGSVDLPDRRISGNRSVVGLRLGRP